MGELSKEAIQNMVASETEASLRSKGFRRKDSQSITATRSTVPVQVDNSPDSMIRIALSQGASMDEIGQLIKFRNDELARLARLEFFEAKKNFAALRDRIVKTKVADYGTTRSGQTGAKYLFEDLDAIEQIVKGPASECGLSYDWKTRYDDKYIYIKCILTHTSGHFEEDEMRGPADQSGGKNFIQAEASTNSYLMRYTLKHVLGLSTGMDDNDGKDGAKNKAVVVTTLVKPDDTMYMSLLKSVRAGTITVDQLEKAYQFTDEQLETLKTVDS